MTRALSTAGHDSLDRPSQRRKLTHTQPAGHGSDAASRTGAGGGGPALSPEDSAAIVAALEQMRKAKVLEEAQKQRIQHQEEAASPHGAGATTGQGARLRAEVRGLQSSESSPPKAHKPAPAASSPVNSNATHMWTAETTTEFVEALAKDVILSQVAQFGFVDGSLPEQLKRGVAVRRDAMVRNLWPGRELSRKAISEELNRLAEAYNLVTESLSPEGKAKPTKEWRATSKDWDKIAAKDSQFTKYWWREWHDHIVLRNCTVTELVEDGVRYVSHVKLFSPPALPPSPPLAAAATLLSPVGADGMAKTKAERELQRKKAEEYDAERAIRKKENEEEEANRLRYAEEKEQQGLAGTDVLFENKRWPLDRSVALVRALAKDPILSQYHMKKRQGHGPAVPTLELPPGETLVSRRLRLCEEVWPERKMTENAMKRKIDSMRAAYENVRKVLTKRGMETPTSEWEEGSKDWEAIQVEDGQWTSLWWGTWHNEVVLRNSRVTQVRADGKIIYSRPSSPSPPPSRKRKPEPEPAPKAEPAPAPASARARAVAAPSDSSGPGVPMAIERSRSKSAVEQRARSKSPRSVVDSAFVASGSSTARKLDELAKAQRAHEKRIAAVETKLDRILALLEAQSARTDASQGRSRRG